MRPEFIINERGSVFCKFHPKYQNFSENVKDLHNIQEPQLEITKFHETRRIWHEVKTCKTCDHFIQNDCFFSRRKITLIRLRAKLQMYRCKFCGSAIDDVFYILYKKIAGQKYNVKIPLVCCLCYISLRSTNMKKEFKILDLTDELLKDRNLATHKKLYTKEEIENILRKVVPLINKFISLI